MISRSQLKYIRSLKIKKYRQEHRAFIAEGPTLAKELLSSDKFSIKAIYCTNTWQEANINLLSPFSSISTLVTEKELEQISSLKTPNQILIVLDQEKDALNLAILQKGYSLYLDRISDPGNMGSIIRIADWFGLSAVVVSRGSVDVYSPKVIQSTMGSIGRIPIIEMDTANLGGLNLPIYATTLVGKNIHDVHIESPAIIAIGSESHGLDESIIRLAKQEITIPRKGKAESLNAAVATGIICSVLN